MAVPPAPDLIPGEGATSDSTDSTPQHPGRAATFRLALVGVLTLVLLASLGVSIWLAATRGFEAVGIDGGADEAQSQREQVMSQTRQFMLRMGTYGPDQLDDQGHLGEYRDLVTEVITPKFATSFEKSVSTAEQIVRQTRVSRTAEVFSVGVATIDSDSATALVAGSFTNAYPGKNGKPRPQDPVPFRLQVDLVHTGGKWLVDNFDPVTGAGM